MRRLFVLPIAVLVFACGGESLQSANSPLDVQINDAAPGNGMQAEVARLRKQGPNALVALLTALQSAEDSGQTERAAHLRTMVDGVAAQRDAEASKLFWYTDLDAAKAEAARTGRPILSLRMLGNLTDELSCANSRFFRTALYPNALVGRAMREHFVLHWSSERPAPRMTIDFGDGRVVERTVTGNSIHYVLSSDGDVLDAIPGLLAPQAFTEALTRAAGLVGKSAEERTAFHNAEIGQAASRFAKLANDTHELAEFPHLGLARLPDPPKADLAQPALLAIPVAMGKGIVERPIVSAMLGKSITYDFAVETTVNWARLASALPADPIDANARAMMQKKRPKDWASGAKPTELDAAAFATLVQNFSRHMQEDTARNQLDIHPVIHAWLRDTPDLSLESLNKRVYSELFLTPKSDPWLGLVPPLEYTGIDADGVVTK